MILDGIVRAAGQISRNLCPSIAQFRVQVPDEALFGLCERPFAHGRVQVIVPPFSALLAQPGAQPRGQKVPAAGAPLVH